MPEGVVAAAHKHLHSPVGAEPDSRTIVKSGTRIAKRDPVGPSAGRRGLTKIPHRAALSKGEKLQAARGVADQDRRTRDEVVRGTIVWIPGGVPVSSPGR